MTTPTYTPSSVPSPDAGPPSVASAASRALRVVLGLALIAAGLVAALTLWGNVVAREETSETTHPAVAQVAIELGAVGEVQVRVHDLEEILVEERRISRLATVETEQRVVGDVLAIGSTRCERGLDVLPFDRCSADYVVTVPPRTQVLGRLSHGGIQVAGLQRRVDLRTGHGGIQVHDTGGDLDLRTGHGTVEVSRATGDVVVDTGHGRIDAHRVDGALEASTGHGAVAVDGGTGRLIVGTGHGTIDVAGTAVDVVELSTGHGDVTFAPSVTPSRTTITTSHGTVSIPLPADTPPLSIDADASGRSVDLGVATDPASDQHLRVHTGHGSIDVRYREP